MALPLFDGCNYTLSRESPETLRDFVRHDAGTVAAGWEMSTPPPGPDGAPYQFIFVGQTAEHRGSAIRLKLVTEDGAQVPDDADVLLETFYQDGTERTVMFQGSYGQFRGIPDQRDRAAALGLQKRAEAGEDYLVRLSVTVSGEGPPPDPTANDSFFELECVKLWWSESA